MSPRSVRSKAAAKRVESQARLSNGKFVENNNVCVVKDCLRSIVNHIAFVNELDEEFVDEDGDRVLDHDVKNGIIECFMVLMKWLQLML